MATPNETMIDIHMHLVPGVDDGALDMEMALSMIMRAQSQGVTRIFATPHSDAFRDDPQACKDAYQALADTASMVCPDMKLYLGCEVYCETLDMDGILDALDSGRYPTMNGTRYVLMEFVQWASPESTIPCLQALLDAGYTPIISHMERYKHLRGNAELVDQFRELGALIQVNAYSLADETDETILNWARQLVKTKRVDFLGTDAHRLNRRPPIVENGLNWLYWNTSRNYAEAIAWRNAQDLLCY